ncbi:hypothetical protein PRIPAC_85160 [Pristionchus pacificus]|uniref:CUB domain-containing protein n=1 Tax=Pristionchus pacificus TaxID=54126 RepID=A0A2A6BTC5_PRIPA|nr:hypothetical protein PRIPAC_85160 [Pristionchus pacificus]|eukprot:PDM69144.1 CUB domain-containing protein [Pristionchus pacificus]
MTGEHLILCNCPDGFELVRDGECRGKHAQLNMADDESVNVTIASCKEIGGIPVIIHDDEQQNYWSASGDGSSFPIGLVCNFTSTKWEWADGSPVDYKPPLGTQNDDLDKPCGKCSWFGYANGDWKKWCDTTRYSVAVFCSVRLQPPVPSADGCDGFVDDSDDGVCYQILDTADVFQGAQMLCKQLGANAASVHTAQENSFIRRLAVSRGAVDGVYLGASVSGKGYDFAWTDGTNWDYENFHPGFPKTGYGDCLAMDTSISSGLWMNINCSEDLPVACIRDQKEVVDPICSNETWKEGQIITSPGFPFNASTFCDYFLTVDAGKKVEAVIDLEANSCCDYLTIYDGYLGGNLIANLTGEIRSKVIKTTTSNIMRVNWVPNGAVNVRGLVMSFKGVLH